MKQSEVTVVGLFSQFDGDITDIIASLESEG